jgi:D-aminopeptidase
VKSCALTVMCIIFAAALACAAQTMPRARDLGVPFDGTPGPLNAITDVKGVEVGYRTMISGEGKLQVGIGPVRTGVTAIFPRGKKSIDPVYAGWFAENGNGEMTGTTWLDESGFLYAPLMITNTHSVGVVRDTVISWQFKHATPGSLDDWWSLPVVTETWDGYLNDINGFHVKSEDALAAIEDARAGPIAEGNVGGGTGMICFEFKGGTGTSSRKLSEKYGGYTVGVLVQCNTSLHRYLRIAGVPVGREIPGQNIWDAETGSIIVVVATDAPLLPHQLKRIARRVTLALGRLGSISGNDSGDIFIAFSTANAGVGMAEKQAVVTTLSNPQLDEVFEATVQATEEAVINALIAARTMTGADNRTVRALSHDLLQEVLRKYNRLANVK